MQITLNRVNIEHKQKKKKIDFERAIRIRFRTMNADERRCRSGRRCDRVHSYGLTLFNCSSSGQFSHWFRRVTAHLKFAFLRFSVEKAMHGTRQNYIFICLRLRAKEFDKVARRHFTIKHLHTHTHAVARMNFSFFEEIAETIFTKILSAPTKKGFLRKKMKKNKIRRPVETETFYFCSSRLSAFFSRKNSYFLSEIVAFLILVKTSLAISLSRSVSSSCETFYWQRNACADGEYTFLTHNVRWSTRFRTDLVCDSMRNVFRLRLVYVYA